MLFFKVKKNISQFLLKGKFKQLDSVLWQTDQKQPYHEVWSTSNCDSSTRPFRGVGKMDHIRFCKLELKGVNPF